MVKGSLTQSGVSDDFAIVVPVYADFDGQPVRLGMLGAVGSATGKEFQVKLPKKPRRLLLNAYQDVLSAEASAVLSH